MDRRAASIRTGVASPTRHPAKLDPKLASHNPVCRLCSRCASVFRQSGEVGLDERHYGRV